MKKLTALFIAILMCLSICACGNDSTENTKAPSNNNEEVSSTEVAKSDIDYSAYLTFKLNEDEKSYTVSDYTGPGTELVIPSEYEGLPVTTVKELDISDSDVERVVLPDSIIEIGEYAMSSSKVSSVVVSANLEVIGDCAFSDCIYLTEIQLPDGLHTIGGSAFSGAGLTSVTLPSTVKQMDMNSFGAMPNLTEATITCAGGRAFKECPALKKVTVIQGAGSMIGDKAFYDCQALESVVFEGDNITNISNEAFYKCEALTTLTLPSKLEHLGGEVFRSCSALQTLEIPATLTSIGNAALMTNGFGEPIGTVICPAGSYAEEYATRNGYTVEIK